MFERAALSGNPRDEGLHGGSSGQPDGPNADSASLVERGRLVRFRWHAISRALRGAPALDGTRGSPSQIMLSSFRKGGIVQFMMGGVIVTIIVAFALDYRPTDVSRSFDSECVVQV